MADPTAEFFELISRRSYEPELAWAEGTIRFDIGNDREIDHRLVTIEHGAMRVSQEDCPADVVVGADRVVFDRLVEGRENVIATWLRAEIRLSGGDALLFFAFWRVFAFWLVPQPIPGPLGAHDPRTLVEPRGARP